MTVHWTHRHWLQSKTKYQWGLQQLCKSCASLAGLVLCFVACFFILLMIAPLVYSAKQGSYEQFSWYVIHTAANLPTSTSAFISARQHAERAICYRKSVCPSVRLLHGWISRKRLKLGSCNFYHTVAQFKFHPEILTGSLRAGASNKGG